MKLLKVKAEPPDYKVGYGTWRGAFDSGKAGVYTVNFAEAFGVGGRGYDQTGSRAPSAAAAGPAFERSAPAQGSSRASG